MTDVYISLHLIVTLNILDIFRLVSLMQQIHRFIFLLLKIIHIHGTNFYSFLRSLRQYKGPVLLSEQ